MIELNVCCANIDGNPSILRKITTKALLLSHDTEHNDLLILLGKIFQRIVGVPIGTDNAPFVLADLVLFYEDIVIDGIFE